MNDALKPCNSSAHQLWRELCNTGDTEGALRLIYEFVERINSDTLKNVDLRICQWMGEQGYATGHGDTIEDLLGGIKACASITPARSVPDGYKLVPVEPTAEMLEHGETAVENNIDEGQDSESSYKIYSERQLAYAGYKAMCAVAPNWKAVDALKTKPTNAVASQTGTGTARELAAKLIPHTTSVHNVDLIEAYGKERERALGPDGGE